MEGFFGIRSFDIFSNRTYKRVVIATAEIPDVDLDPQLADECDDEPRASLADPTILHTEIELFRSRLDFAENEPVCIADMARVAIQRATKNREQRYEKYSINLRRSEYIVPYLEASRRAFYT